jgi:hypothetical protein
MLTVSILIEPALDAVVIKVLIDGLAYRWNVGQLVLSIPVKNLDLLTRFRISKCKTSDISSLK